MRKPGYVYLFRQLIETSFYKDSVAVHLAVHLLIKANHKDRKICINGKEIIIKRGQLLSGRNILSEETGIHPSTIYRKLELLKNVGFSNSKSNNRYSIITINKYNHFQQPQKPKRTRKRTTSEQPANTPNTLDKLKNIYIDDSFNTFWCEYPEKQGKAQAYKAWLKLSPNSDLIITIMDALARQKEYKERAVKRREWVPRWPYGATWLRNERWKDEIKEDKKAWNRT